MSAGMPLIAGTLCERCVELGKAKPRKAREARQRCERCGAPVCGEHITYQHFGAWWLCPACNYTARQAASAAPKEPHR